jgi:hypothetical protein
MKFRCNLGGGTALLALALGGIVGCGNGRVPTYDVAGQVLVKGKPAEGAFVVFHPVEPTEPEVPRPYCRTDADGNFKLTTYVLGDGAPANRYRLTIVWRPLPRSTIESEKPDRLQGKYSNPATSGLKVTIGKQPVVLAPFDLIPP